MKTSLLALTLSIATFTSAHAFNLEVSCQFNQAQGECQVLNYTARPVYCEIEAQGVTFSGAWANGFVNGYVMPGDVAYVYVNANNPYMDPLANVNGVANCRF